MPPGKKPQTSAMLYTLIAFVGLFIFATTFAVIYYVKAEEFRTSLADLQRQIDDLANSSQRQAIGTIVGDKQTGKTRLAQIVDYLNRTIILITGGVAEPTSAEVNVKNVEALKANALALAQQNINIASLDPNAAGPGLIRVIQLLKAELDNTIAAGDALKQQLADLQNKFDDALAAGAEERKTLLAEKEKFQQQVNEAEQDYKNLKVLLEQTADQRVQALWTQLEEEKANLKTLNQELLKTQAKLDLSQSALKKAKEEIAIIKPPPDKKTPAYQPDGEIIILDDRAKVVHLNIGSNNHVYQGLTFSVYDTLIPKDGKAKAEVEVFDISKTYSSARILRSEINRPILKGDIVANLIWDSKKTNLFVLAGDFDINDDGVVDNNADDKIKSLIRKWGGAVAESVSIDTDFVILGSPPKVIKKPTFEDLELRPDAMKKYDASMRIFNRYKEICNTAQTLWIPVFKYDTFLYYIGYKGQTGKPGAF